jgi:hypothetical protein
MFGIGYGPDKNEKNQFGALQQQSGFASTIGEKDLTDVSSFLDAVLSGDSSRISQALAPEISAAKGRAQEQKESLAQFGNRSGGTTSAQAHIDEATQGDLTNMEGSLTDRAAGELGSLGSNALGMGIEGTETGFDEAKTMHDQHLAQLNDIFQSSANMAEFGLNLLPANSGGFVSRAQKSLSSTNFGM